MSLIIISFTWHTRTHALINKNTSIDRPPVLDFDYEGRFEDHYDEDFYLDLGPIHIRQHQPTSPAAILNILKEIGALETLQQEFFLRTNPLNKRSVLDQPLFEPHRCSYKGHWVVGGHLFYSEIDRANFTKNSTRLDSYLALGSESLINLLQNNVQRLKPLFGADQFNLNIALVFSLFENMALEDRQAGIMFHLERAWKKNRLRILIPFIEQERNFSLTKKEREAVEREFGAVDEEEQKKFQENHLISDRLGFGDTRIEFDGRMYKSPRFSLRLGGQLTIPTAFDVATGLIGTTFEKPSNLPTFSFTQLFDLGVEFMEAKLPEKKEEIQEEAFNIIRDFALGSLDRLSANLLDTTTGNNKHFGIGAYIRTKTNLGKILKQYWAKKAKWESRISLEYLTPHDEKRFFIFKNNPGDFETRNFSDDNQAADNLAFLEQEFVKKFYLLAFDTHIQPGLIFRWTSKLCYQSDRWGLNLGTDLWIQGKEKQRNIKAPRDILFQLDLEKAQPSFAYQGKIFGGIVAKISRPDYAWYVSLNGSVTTNTIGIGNQFTISLNVERNF